MLNICTTFLKYESSLRVAHTMAHIYGVRLSLTINSYYITLKYINRLILVRETHCVLYAVGTEFFKYYSDEFQTSIYNLCSRRSIVR